MLSPQLVSSILNFLPIGFLASWLGFAIKGYRSGSKKAHLDLVATLRSEVRAGRAVDENQQRQINYQAAEILRLHDTILSDTQKIASLVSEVVRLNSLIGQIPDLPNSPTINDLNPVHSTQ